MPALTAQNFLDLFDRILPPAYLQGMKTGQGPGYELFQAVAAVMARVSQAVNTFDEFAFILSSMGGQRATGTVQLQRPAGALPAVTVKSGTQVTTSKGQRTFITTADVVFGMGVQGPLNVPVQAIAAGWEWNLPGQVTALDGEILPGEIDTILFLNEDPVVEDLTFTVSQQDPTTGGRAAMLDQLGADRGIVRRNGERDPQYKLRIRTLPDTISPAAVRRAVDSFLAPYGLTGTLIETWNPAFVAFCDDPRDTPYFVMDDPRPNPPFRDRWLDEVETRGAFIIVVPNIPCISMRGIACDDPGLTPADFDTLSTRGKRALPGCDIPATVSDQVLQGCVDGTDLGKNAVYAGLYNMLQQIKAAGVAAVLELAGQ